MLSGHVSHPAYRRQRCAASSPIRCRSGLIAAPGGRKPITCWSGWWTRPRALSATTARGCAGAISFRARPCPTRRRWAQHTTAAILPPYSTKRWSRATMPASTNAGAKAQSAAAGAASASPASSNIPAAARREGALIAFPGGNVVSLGLHVQSTGQGHASVFPRLVAQKLGIAPEQVRHRHGDTNLEIKGAPSVASRSAMTAGSASLRAAETVLAKGRAVAAKALDVAEDRDFLPRRLFRGGRHQPPPLAVRCGGAGEGNGRARRDRRDARHPCHDRHAADLPERLPYRGSRGRSRHRRGHHGAVIPRSTTAAACSTTRSPRDNCMAASPRAWGRR